MPGAGVADKLDCTVTRGSSAARSKVPAKAEDKEISERRMEARIEVGSLPFTLEMKDDEAHTWGYENRDKLQPLH